MYEMSQQHPVWVVENHVTACNSVEKHMIVSYLCNFIHMAVGFGLYSIKKEYVFSHNYTLLRFFIHFNKNLHRENYHIT